MGLFFRRSKKLGPFRLTLSGKGVSLSGGAGGARYSASTTGRRTKSLRLGRGLHWRKSRTKRK